MNPLSQIGVLILSTAFEIYIVILWLRFLLQLLHADYYNQIAQFVVRATAPLVDPLSRALPPSRSWNLAALLLIVLVKMLELTLVGMLTGSGTMTPPVLLIYTVISLLFMAANFYFWMLIISVVLSWVAPGSHSPAAELVHQVVEPLLAPCRRLLPAMGGLDLSPIIAFLGIQAFKILLGAASAQLFAVL